MSLCLEPAQREPPVNLKAYPCPTPPHLCSRHRKLQTKFLLFLTQCHSYSRDTRFEAIWDFGVSKSPTTSPAWFTWLYPHLPFLGRQRDKSAFPQIITGRVYKDTLTQEKFFHKPCRQTHSSISRVVPGATWADMLPNAMTTTAGSLHPQIILDHLVP